MRKANGRKIFRTKFTQNQKESMLEFAQSVGWKLKKRDEEQISEFCSKIGVQNQAFKVWLHNNKKKNSTGGDILPECLIKKILIFLSFKEAARMSVLSKTWLQAWSTLPNLKFRVDYLEGNMKIVDDIMERYKDGKIPIEKFDLSYSVYSTGEDFPVIDKWLDIALQNSVKDLVFEVHSFPLYPLPIFKILAAKSLSELVLSDCDLMQVSLSSGVTNCNSLRTLSLYKVNLDDNMLRTLLNSCPLIVTFICKYCWGLEKIELLNLQKIKSISIMTHREIYQFVKIQAPTLEHMSYAGHSEELDVVECPNLISLNLSYVRLCDGFLHNLISRSQSLKVLTIRDCSGTGEIDSSNLVSLEYIGDQIPQLKMPRESGQLKHSKIILKCCNDLNAAWFCKLRKFLSNSTSWPEVFLYFFECDEINIKYMFQLDHRGSTPHVDVLNVNIIRSSVKCPAFVDALLGSCHPRRLNLSATAEMNKCFFDYLVYKKNPSHYSSHESKPWHSQLKEIKAFYGENQPLQLRNRELAIRTLAERKEVYFLLDWQCINE